MNYQKTIPIALIVIVVIIGGVLIWQKWEEKITPPQKSQPEQTQKQQKKPFCSQSEKQGSGHILKGDTIFCDTKGRMWTETATSGLTWEKAVDYCEDLSYAGFQDWQLPSCESDENCILYQFGKEACGWKKDEEKECAPSWDKNANNSSSKYPYGYWSSTEMKNTEKAGRVDFYNGNLLSATKDHIFSVRCIRK